MSGNQRKRISLDEPGERRRREELANAELALVGATALIVVGVGLVVVGYEHVVNAWLGLVLGVLLAAVGGVLFWRGNDREVAARDGRDRQSER